MKDYKKHLETSRSVILNSAQKNGALTAANPLHPAYPKEAKNYRFVWPRDGAYSCIALDILKDDSIQDRFFRWCEKAEGFKKSGLFFEKYHIDGRKALKSFQPDQTGTLLLAIHHHIKTFSKDKNRYKSLIEKSADGICSVWNKDHFTKITTDLWEEKKTFPDQKENFTYSTAACIRGLRCAHDLFEKEEWQNTANEMETALKTYFKEKPTITRSFGQSPDERIDASLLGLVWPFGIYDADDRIMKDTIDEIRSRIEKPKGIMRYEGDDYDGWMYRKTIHRKKGAGAWPLLTFWLSIYYSEKKDRETAEKYIDLVLKNLKSEYIPEQLFENDYQQSITPLCWSHAMLVIAIERLRNP